MIEQERKKVTETEEGEKEEDEREREKQKRERETGRRSKKGKSGEKTSKIIIFINELLKKKIKPDTVCFLFDLAIKTGTNYEYNFRIGK